MALLNKLKQMLSPGGRGAASDTNRSDKTLETRVAIVGSCIIASFVAVMILSYLDSRHHMQSMAYSALALEQKVISKDIAINVQAALSRDKAAFNQLKNSQSRYNETILILDRGNNMMGVQPLPREFSNQYSVIKDIWQGYNKNVSTIVAAESSINTVNEKVTQINESLPELLSISNKIISDLIRNRAPGKNIALASSQLSLIRGMENNLNLILNDGKVVVASADRLSADANQIEKQLLAMLKGSKSLGIEKFKGATVVTNLVKFADLYSVVKNNIVEIQKISSDLFKMYEAVVQIRSQTSNLTKASNNLILKVKPPMNASSITTKIAMVVAVLFVLSMMAYSLRFVRSSRTRLSVSQEQNDKNQRAILRLLDEMTNLAEGDLSTHTTVTEDITGAIADSVNYSIDALRDLVGTINKTAVQVGSAVRKTQKTTGQLEKASIAQAKEISSKMSGNLASGSPPSARTWSISLMNLSYITLDSTSPANSIIKGSRLPAVFSICTYRCCPSFKFNKR